MPETMRGVWQGRRSGAAEDMSGPSGDVQQGPVAWGDGGGGGCSWSQMSAAQFFNSLFC